MMETFEWIHSWLDHTDRHDHPRVLLIGDSICNGYEEFVNRADLSLEEINRIFAGKREHHHE
mgnify:CR=1 FL=1